MRLEQIGALGYGAQVARSTRREQESDADVKRSGARFSRKDSYTPAAGDVHKADSVKEVEKRVKSNFYNSEVVNDDLADLLTKLFDR